MAYPLVLLEIACALPEAAWRAMLPELTPELQARALRYLAPQSQRNLVVSRTRLAQVLAALGLDQTQVLNASNGRPYHAQQALQFNLSHSEDQAVLALSRDPQLIAGLGVDLEWCGRTLDIAAIGRRFFTPRESAWIGQERHRFFHVWTRKEAVLKSNGVGLRVELDSFEVLNEQVPDHVTGRPLFLQTAPREDCLVSWAVTAPPAEVVFLNDTQGDWLERLGQLLEKE